MTALNPQALTRWIAFAAVVLAGLAVVIIPVVAGSLIEDSLIAGVGLLIYAGIGGLIIYHRNGHLTGWLLALTGLAIVVANGLGYLPAITPAVAGWVNSWAWNGVMALLAALTLTFPSGRPPSGLGLFPRLGRISFRLLPWLVLAAALTEQLGGPELSTGNLNPIGFLPSWVNYVALIGPIVILIASALSLEIRRRRARGVERAQLQWVIFALTLLATAIGLTVLYVFGSIAFGQGDPGDEAWAPVFLLMVTLPAFFGIAVLRYRLYDIDRIISRTISWGILTALVAGIYLALVFLLGELLPFEGDVAVAGSTLAVAVVFTPLRHRLQDLVDRRFNRTRFDAQQTMARLAVRLRAAADLGQLRGEVEAALAESLQPSRLAVWVNPSR